MRIDFIQRYEIYGAGMIKKIELLLELQELSIILDESEILHGKGSETSGLKERCKSIRAQIDTDTLARYDRLSRLGLAVVQLSGSMCLGCNMSIPAGDLNRIKNGNVAPVCPNCGYFLNLKEDN